MLRHGGQYLRTGLKGSPFEHSGWVSAGSVPFTVHLERPRVERILKAGRYRFFRALMQWAPLPSVVTVGAASGLVAAVWIIGWEWAHVYAAISRVVTELLTFDAVIECIWLIRLSYVAAIALPGLIPWLASREAYTKWVWPAARYKLLRNHAGIWRKVLTLWKT